MKFANAVVKYRVPIIIVSLVLMVPALLGMIGTRINYDMLDYLPSDMDTVKGQEELMNEFGKGAFSFIVVEDMPDKDVAAMAEQIKTVEHVDTVLCWQDMADITIPKEFL
ncbi:MAG TPA: hypothetical protein DDX72_02345, partial [Ruminococcaceae bacterium]|nr:hypothetical protein [Oscillospiraceae bacterium]